MHIPHSKKFYRLIERILKKLILFFKRTKNKKITRAALSAIYLTHQKEDFLLKTQKNKNLKDAALFKHGAEQYCKIYLNFLQDQKFKIVSPAKENLFSFTPGLSEKNIFKMSIQQNNSNAKNKK